MPELKLSKLPDRTPVKISITVSPELSRALQAYAAAYRESYGQDEPVAELIPYMLDVFLSGDRQFAKSRKGQDKAVAPTVGRKRRSAGPDVPSA